MLLVSARVAAGVLVTVSVSRRLLLAEGAEERQEEGAEDQDEEADDEVALKVSEVEPSVPTVMKPRRAVPSSSRSTSSSAWAQAASRARENTVYSHFMVMLVC